MRRPSSATLVLIALLSGCVVTAWIEDQPVQAPDPTDDDDSAPPSPCRLPVPNHVVLDTNVWGDSSVSFYVPTPGWALATLHASRQIDGLDDQEIDLRLSPSFFFGVALQASYMGCSDDTPADPLDPSNAYTRQPETDSHGCLGLSRGTVWVDLCRMYPDDLACDDEAAYDGLIPSTDQAATGRDNVETSVLAWGWYTVYAYAMLQWPSGGAIADPDAWIAAADDDYAAEKLLGVMHRETPFSPLLGGILTGCADRPLEECLTDRPNLQDHVLGIAGHTASLEAGVAAGRCYDEVITVADVAEYVEAIAPLFPDRDWTAAADAARGALVVGARGREDAPFQSIADAVLDAIDGAAPLRLRCPGVGLSTNYGVDCPP